MTTARTPSRCLHDSHDRYFARHPLRRVAYLAVLAAMVVLPVALFIGAAVFVWWVVG